MDIVFRFILSRVGNHLVAEDLTSETFLRALCGINTLSYRGKQPQAWLFTIAHNVVVDHNRSAWNRREVATRRARRNTE